MPFKKILVPLDGSANSEMVLGWVDGLAKALKAWIVLLAVANPRDVSHSEEWNGPDRAGKVSNEAVDHASEAARHYLESEANRHKGAGLKISQRVVTGHPAEAIVEEAEKAGADMIAMATHRGRAVERGILGSVTDTVLRTSPVPVLAVRPDGPGSFTNNAGAPSTIIVPLDGSKLAEESVTVATEIADLCSAEMIFIRAVHLPAYAVSGPGSEYYASEYGVDIERRKAAEYLAPFVQQAQQRGIEAQAHAVLGNPAARVLEETAHVKGGLVVITSHGRGGWKRMLLGSVADKLVRASRHPVLVLTHHGE